MCLAMCLVKLYIDLSLPMCLDVLGDVFGRVVGRCEVSDVLAWSLAMYLVELWVDVCLVEVSPCLRRCFW